MCSWTTPCLCRSVLVGCLEFNVPLVGTYSAVIKGPRTLEVQQNWVKSFSTWFVLIDTYFSQKKKSQKIPPLEVVRIHQNPRWPPSANLKIIFSTVWPSMLYSISILTVFGSRNSYFTLFWWFDLFLTFKSKMAANFSQKSTKSPHRLLDHYYCDLLK